MNNDDDDILTRLTRLERGQKLLQTMFAADSQTDKRFLDAIEDNNVDLVKAMIELGVRDAKASLNGRSALFRALTCGRDSDQIRPEIAHFLFDHGAEPGKSTYECAMGVLLNEHEMASPDRLKLLLRAEPFVPLMERDYTADFCGHLVARAALSDQLHLVRENHLEHCTPGSVGCPKDEGMGSPLRDVTYEGARIMAAMTPMAWIALEGTPEQMFAALEKGVSARGPRVYKLRWSGPMEEAGEVSLEDWLKCVSNKRPMGEHLKVLQVWETRQAGLAAIDEIEAENARRPRRAAKL